ncbi:MAG: LysM peptidoglycan-binding domain-containing protein [Cellvibrionaceae bacterium]
MKKFAAGLLGIALSFSPMAAIQADEIALKDGHPNKYIVKKGDTLWDISSVFLTTPWRWTEIWQVNPQIMNPHLIYPGDTVYLRFVNGQPQLHVTRGADGRTMKLSPSKRISPLTEAIPSIPLDEIAAFLSESRIVDEEDFEDTPHVLAGGENRLIVGAGDRLYARGMFTEGVKVYGVYRPGDAYRDPESGNILGYSAQDIGAVKMIATKPIDEDDLEDGYVGTFSVIRTNQEIRVEDRLLPSEEREVDSIFYPSAPEADVNGVIMSVEGGVSQIGTLDVVSINRGLRDGLDVGNVLTIYKRGGKVKDRLEGGTIELPDERAGMLIIFRSFKKMSFGLVLEASRPLSVNDKVKNP